MWKLRSILHNAGPSRYRQHRRASRRTALARRLLSCENLEARNLLACGALVCVDVQFVDSSAPSVALTSLQPAQNYEAQVYIQDDRGASASGVFQAYFDVTYDATLISLPDNEVGHGGATGQYRIRTLGDASVAGLIDAAGGTSAGVPNPKGDSYLLFSFPFQTDAVGTLTLNLAPDNLSTNKVEFFTPSGTVTDIAYVGNSIEISDPLTPEVSIAATTAGSETGPTNGVFTVSQALATTVPTVVSYSVGGTATAGSDYTALSGSVTIAANSTTATITVPILNDNVVDPNETVTVTLTGITSGDAQATISPTQNVASLTIADNDTAGVTVSPTSGLTTTEAGDAATFQVSLTSQPTGNVTIGLSSSNLAEGTVSPSSLVFTPANWNVAQTVTATGVNDAVDDGDRGYSIVTAAATSTDPNYNGLNPSDVAVTNIDNDTAGISVTPTTGLTTSEAGTTQTFTVRLNSQPTADVTIGISSSDTGEGIVSKSSLTFTPSNWNTAQTVTVTGVDDAIDDGNQPYQIVTAAAASADPKYSGLNAADVSLTNTDDDTFGFIVSPTTGLTTSEDGGFNSFTVRLSSQPTANVTLGLAVSNSAEGSLNVNSLVFTPQNWLTPQAVRVTGVDDDVADGDVSYSIQFVDAVSDDLLYSGTKPADLAVTNTDDDVVGIFVDPTSGLVSSEEGPGGANFSVVLRSAPTAEVTIGLTSNDTSEGTLSTDSLTFTSANWNVPQIVTVTGVEDDLVDGNVSYAILTTNSVSEDPLYNNLVVADVTVTNTDNDVAGVLVSPTSGLITSESGQTTSFDVRLTAQPTADVTIDLTSSDSGEGTLSTARLTFTPANWKTLQTVTVTGVDDDSADGSVPYTIFTEATESTDTNFNGLVVADVSVTNTDDDVVAILVAPIAGLLINESGSTDSFTVRLSSRPTANVTIGIDSDNTAEGTVDKTSLTFTPDNWNTPQTVTVSGVDDLVDDDDVGFSIITTAAVSDDSAYNGLDAADVSVTNQNDDTAAIVVQPTSGLQTSEFGNSDSFTIVLTSQPIAPVTINLTSDNTAEGTVDKSSVVFDASNWNVPQTVTVTGVDDLVDDDDVLYSVITAAAVSTDTAYSGLEAADVSVTNIDDDVPGFAIVPTAGLVTNESGGTASFDIVLTSQPTADVTVNLASSNTAEGTVSVPSVTFTPANWDTPQTVTVTGVDDDVVDGAVAFAIETTAAISTDTVFAGINPPDVSVTNQDDDTTTLSIANVSVAEGDGVGATLLVFDVSLSNAVAGGFSVDFATADGTADSADYVARSGTLTFAGTAGETQTVTVQVNQDAVVEADETFLLSLSNVSGIPASLAQQIQLPGSSAVGTILNDDSAAITLVGPAATLEGTADADTLLSFTVQLSAAVQGGFSVSYSTADGTALLSDDDYTDNDGTLSFAGTAGETQTITVAVRADDRVESDETLQVSLGTLSGLPVAFADAIALPSNPATATILNDDFPRLLFSDVTVSAVEGSDGATTEFRFQVTLTDAVEDADGFDVPFATSDGTATVAGGDYQSSSGTLHFDGTAGEVQTISVFVSADTTVETDETFTVTLGDLIGLAASETVLVPVSELQATIEDDDTANLVLTTTSSSQLEGGLFQFSVTLSAPVQGAFSIDFASSDDSATVADGDYAAANGTLNFAGAGAEVHTFSIQSTSDNKVERDELFAVALQSLSGLPSAIAESISVSGPLALTLLNDDTATITMTSAASTPEGDTGTTELAFDVALSAPVDGGFSLPFQTVDGTAAAGSDYTGQTDTLTFSGLTSETQTIRVLVNGDAVVEADETFQLVLGQLDGLLAGLEDDVVVQTSNATGTIANDDTATLSIVGPGAINEGTAATPTEFQFTVTLSAAVQDGLSLAFNTQDGTATAADNDFLSLSGVLNFAGAANESQTVTVNVTADDRVEPNETFSLVLGTIGGLPQTAVDSVTIASDTATATIVNDDFPRLLLSDVTPSSTEGTTADGFTEFQFTVTLTDAVDDADGFQIPVNINDGTATVADGDYQDNDVVLQFAGTAGETQTLTVRVRQDSVLENDETFQVAMGQIIGLAAGETVLIPTNQVTATIVDDDSATLSLAATSASGNEGNAGTTAYTFEATLSAAVQGGFWIAYNTNDQTATVADGDYVDNDGQLNFAGTAGETQSITVTVNGDTKLELDETFTVGLGAVSGLDAAALQRLTIQNSPAVATIVNDDAAALSILGPGTINEGTGQGTTAFEFTVTLNNAVASGFNLAYQTSEGTASVANNDFVDNDGVLTFAGTAGETKTIRVLVNQDAAVEPDETFQVALGQISGLDAALRDLIAVDTAAVTATIGNDDSATIGFVSSVSDVLEADGTHSVAVRLNVSGGGVLTEAATVNVVVRAASTASSSDFVLQTTAITFPAGSGDGTVQNVNLTLAQDGLVEDIETVVLGLELPAGNLPAVSLGTTTAHSVSIIDDAMDATLSGRVWVDANDDGALNVGELTIPSVPIRLTGTTLGGDTVDLHTTTDSNGFYLFTDLPAGTYALAQTQPAGFMDGQDVLGTVAGVASGNVAADVFTAIVIRPSQDGSGYLFGERGLEAAQASRTRILSRPRNGTLLGNPVTADMLAASTASTSQAFATSETAQGEAGAAIADELAEAMAYSPAASDARMIDQAAFTARDTVFEQADDWGNIV